VSTIARFPRCFAQCYSCSANGYRFYKRNFNQKTIVYEVIVKTLHYDQFQKTIELHSEALQVKCFTYLTLFGIISVQQNKLDHLILLFF